MNTQEPTGPHYLAILGPDDKPNATVMVRIIGKSETPDFVRAISEHGEQLTIHRNKLKKV